MTESPITSIRPQGDIVIATLSGSLTVSIAPELRQGLMALVKQHSPRILAVNIEHVDFMDSSALGVFVEIRRALGAAQGCLTFTNTHEDIRGLMRIMNLDAIFSFVDTEEELTSPSA